MNIFEDFISLLFPRICIACGNKLFRNENIICSLCTYMLPKTNFHLLTDNPVSKMFWGRVNLESAASFLYFRKGGRVQRMIHYLKYRGHKEIGIHLGSLYGRELTSSELFNNVEVIIPVPLHVKKLKKRGFNQSTQFANGLGESMGKDVANDVLIRKIHSATQTKKSRYERWQNVEQIFAVNHIDKIAGKHILLVDDVVTTGSTLEACAQILSTVTGVQISIATIAFAE